VNLFDLVEISERGTKKIKAMNQLGFMASSPILQVRSDPHRHDDVAVLVFVASALWA
jgi:hypothetical protein